MTEDRGRNAEWFESAREPDGGNGLWLGVLLLALLFLAACGVAAVVLWALSTL